MRFPIVAVFLVVQISSASLLFAYSENGHRIVGAIADGLIADKPAAEAVKKLLGPITLERASTLPDELRGEDRKTGTFTLPENPALEQELLAFRAANPPYDGDDLNHLPPSHHWFHYTDVPIQSPSYAATKKGVSKWDIVHMIPYCVRVIEGKEKPDNELKITPAVALVLLSHYVGDIHQPMHVGAIFMNKNGDRLDPNTAPSALESRGGNDINFGATNLHAYWDYDAVESCLSYRRRLLGKLADQYGPRDIAAEMIAKEPTDWKADPALPVEAVVEKWADEILPIAREAHDRLKMLPQQQFSTDRKGKPMVDWTAVETPHVGRDSYSIWASKTVEKELPKAGWRLAGLLEDAFAASAR